MPGTNILHEGLQRIQIEGIRSWISVVQWDDSGHGPVSLLLQQKQQYSLALHG